MVELFDLVGFIGTLFQAVLYPFNAVLHMVWGWIMLIVNAVLALYSAFTNFFTSIIVFIQTISSVMFPGEWGTLIVIGLSIVFALRIYSFLKDVSIGGFKL